MNENTESAADERAEGGATSDDDLLKEMRDFLKDRIAIEGAGRLMALDDLKFLTGDQWPADVERSRKADNRPCLTVNKLPTFLHQVTNDQRQNRSSIKVHAVDDDADVETADVLQGLIRHIEYDSNADIAYDTAVNSAAAIGVGYWRLVTEYSGPDSFDQDIKFKRIRNSFTVYMGPHTEPDASDMLKAMITEELEREEFKRQFPDADTGSDIDAGVGDALQEWLSKDKIRVAEFYKVCFEPDTLYRTIDGQSVYKSEMDGTEQLAPGRDGKPQSRPTERREVWWYKATGCEILERCEIKCNWIPIFEVTGDEWDVEGQVIRQGLIRNAKGPAQMYNVWMTAATEEIGLRPKIPYIGAAGQFASDKKWGNANVRSYPFMEYDPVTVDGVLAPAPQRQPMADVPAGVLAMAMHAADDVKATTGIFNASLGQQGNETSGKAIIARQKEGDVGSFHYTDNLRRNVRQCARCIVWMIPFYYDTERMVRIMGEDETVQHVPINQAIPPEQQQPDPKTQVFRTVKNDLTVGKYDVVVSSGPSYSTLRAETADAMIQVGQSWPQMWQIGGDLLVKNLDWHNADELAERIKRTIPPNIIGPEEGQQAPLPPEVQQHMAQQDQMIQQLHQALQEAQSGIAVAQVNNQSKERISMSQAQAQHEREVGFEQIKAQQASEDNRIKMLIAQEQLASAERIAQLNTEVALAKLQTDMAQAQQARDAEQVMEGRRMEYEASAKVFDAHQAANQAANQADQTAQQQPKEDHTAAAMQQMAEAHAKVADALVKFGRPKRIVNDANGNPIGVEHV